MNHWTTIDNIKPGEIQYNFLQHFLIHEINGILLPKLFWPTERKKCSSDREKLLKYEGEAQEFTIYIVEK